MARRAFYSFHYKPDNWRAAKVRQMGVLEGNQPANDNDWEAIKSQGERAIKNWIDKQMHGKSVVIVLIGEKTAGRKYIDYEIEKGWNDKKGVLGIYVHNLEDSSGNKCAKGKNPFEHFTIENGSRKLSNIVKAYDPPYTASKSVYNYIKDNLADWIEEAIEIRKSP